MGNRRTAGPRRGYNLVILMVLVTVMSILIAIALPSWSAFMQREREKELIFRGLQYAEAIRVFQVRTGRYPVSLRELLENEPRTIRRLWTDPFRDDGKWALVTTATGGRQVGGAGVQGAAPPDRGRRDGGVDEEEDGEPPVPIEDVSVERDFGAPEGIQGAGPILGVRSLTEEDALISFMGSNSIGDWEFTADLIPVLPEAASLDNVPRLTSRYIGKSFPQGLEPAQGGLPGGPSGNLGDAGDTRGRRGRPNRTPAGGDG